MRITQILMSGLTLASLFLAGLPEPAIAQGGGAGSSPANPPAQLQPAGVNNDQLSISLEETKETALLGKTSIVRGIIKNNGQNPQFNVGWTVRLPQGVEYLGAKAGPADYGSPKATILLYGNGKTETVIHWANAADVSPGSELWFEISVKNTPPEGNQPKQGKHFKLEDDMKIDAWAKGSTQAAVLPSFMEYGYVQNVENDPTWAKSEKNVSIKGIESTVLIEDQHNGRTIRGNKLGQRQKVLVNLERTQYGNLTLNRPVSVDLDPSWEIMGQCVKGGQNCFTPTENDVFWENGKWKLNIPASHFTFDSDGKALATFEVAALDKINVQPTGDQKKVNMAGLSGDGREANPQRDDSAYNDDAYKNNTGDSSQNVTATISGSTGATYTHPWHNANNTKYPNHTDISVTLPTISSTIQDTSIVLTTEMVNGGPYKNGELAHKTLVVKNNEYASLANDRQIVVTIPKQECPVNKGTQECVTSGTIKIQRTVEANGTPVVSDIDATVVEGSNNVYTVTIPSEGIDPDTSRTETFTFNTKIQDSVNGQAVVNGTPLKSTAVLSWTHGSTPISIESVDELDPALLDVLNTVAFPSSNGSCPAAMSAMPTAQERRDLVDQPENKQLAEQITGTDKWGKRRKAASGKTLCFQVLMKFPEGITTKEPKLNLYLPPEAELEGAPQSSISLSGPNAAAAVLDSDSAVDSATKPVKNPTERTPLTYNLGETVPGGAFLSMVYKVTIKNAKVADPSQPEVLYDNLAKLSYKDFDGGIANARDLAGYEFIGPVLMLSVDQAEIAGVRRGSTQNLTYTVTNVGDAPVQAGTIVAIKMPEGTTCADFTVSNGATSTCQAGEKAGQTDGLLSGDYLLVTLDNPIGSKDPNGSEDEKTFQLAYKISNSHVPKMGYEVEAGIVGYKAQAGSAQTAIYIPKTNAYCKPQAAGLSETEAEQKNTDCTKKIATDQFNIGDPTNELGKTVFIGANKAEGGMTTEAVTTIITRHGTTSLNGTSSDLTNDNGNPLVVVPGEKGSIVFTITPNLSDDPGNTPADLGGPDFGSNDAFFAMTIKGVKPNDTQYVKTLDEIKDAFVTELGADFVDRDRINKTWSDAKQHWYIHVPLKKMPAVEKNINLSDLFIATNDNVVIAASINHKAFTLKHRDTVPPQLGTRPRGDNIPTGAGSKVFIRKAPALSVTKQVTNPVINRITGNAQVTYSVTISNTSEVTAHDVNVTDTLPDGFTHHANMTSVAVAGGANTALEAKTAWALSDSDKVGVWPGDNTKFSLPGGASVTLTYVANAPALVSTNYAYTNRVQTPFASQPNAPLGVLTGNQSGEATVLGQNIMANTTLESELNHAGNGSVQPGEMVKATTRITIPPRSKVNNLSVLTELVGHVVDTSNTPVVMTCVTPNSAFNCSNQQTILRDGNKVGAVLKNGLFENTTDENVIIEVAFTNVLVTPNADLSDTHIMSASGNVYSGNTAPGSIADFNNMTKTSSGNSGDVTVNRPRLSLHSEYVLGDKTTQVDDPIEPGTPIYAKIEMNNATDQSVLRKVTIDGLVAALAEKGLTIDPSFDQSVFTDQTLRGGDANKQTLFIPLVWDASKFTGPNRLTGEQRVTVRATGQSGPAGVLPNAGPKETVGDQETATSALSLVVAYPKPTISVAITNVDGSPITDNPPTLRANDEFKVTFTPDITFADGFNPVMCVKSEEIGAPPGTELSIRDLTLHQPAAGVAIVPGAPDCAQGEVQVSLPAPINGRTLPSVSFIVTPSGSAIRRIANSNITATLKVDDRINGAQTPSTRPHTAQAVQPIRVSPGVDFKIDTQWLAPDGTPITGNATYNDFDTETNPVKAKIAISNIGEDFALGASSTVKLVIPDNWTVEPPADPQGWTCALAVEGGKNTLTCSRTTDLPGKQTTPFEVTIKSPSGPGVRLPGDPLTITGGYPDNRAINDPFDTNNTNDKVNTTATVTVPKPDLAADLAIANPVLTETDLEKTFTVNVAHTGDPIRAHEATVTLTSNVPTLPIAITNANGWQCGPTGQSVTCVYPNAHTAGTALPPISAKITAENKDTPVNTSATTSWMRTSPGGQPVVVPDVNPANDASVKPLKDFAQWVDGAVTVEMEHPKPKPGEDPNPMIKIVSANGGANIPVGTKIRVSVPDGAVVVDGGSVNGCALVPGQANVYECATTAIIPPEQTVDGPTVTGIEGPNQTVSVELILDGDPNPGNDRAQATTQRNAPVPGPVPTPKPTPDPSASPTPEPTPEPIPDPTQRPSEIPPAPAPPAKPAPVNPGHTPSPKTPEERASSWVDSTFAANTKAPIVLIGRDNVFADSLSSGGLQGILEAPLLLNPVTHLSAQTKANLERLQPEQVIILGGPVAQSHKVEQELKQLGWNVSRVHGPTRVETAIDAARTHAQGATQGVLARAYASNWGSGTQAFADALGGGAFAARKERPVFLTETGQLTETLKAYLPTSKIKHMTIIGSTEAVSFAVEAQLNALGIATTRISGENRAQTAVGVANALGYWHAAEAESVLVVNGESENAWTDAFPAALYAKRHELPVVLSGTNALLPETAKWLAPGALRNPPTKVICGFSVGAVKACGYSPATAHTNENQ